MTRHLALLVACVGLAPIFGFTACGEPTPTPARIAERMAGPWDGNTFISRPGHSDTTVAQHIDVALVDATHASFVGLCPSGPPVVLAGEGTRLVATTTITCSPVPVDGCETAAYVFTALEVSLYSGNSLNVTANGTIVGCDATTPMRFVFDAAR